MVINGLLDDDDDSNLSQEVMVVFTYLDVVCVLKAEHTNLSVCSFS